VDQRVDFRQAVLAAVSRRSENLPDRLLRLFAGDGARSQLVAGMLRRDPNEVAAYWFQLVVAVGIATLGLVLGSGAVIIGAMLVAPLMGPIVGLALGFSTGSPFLVLRSSGRIVMSIVVAVGGGAVITLLVPIHELNGEIASRTSPTILDLATASFCALAGVYATLRPGSDTAATAAGTSIGISLVPPLCASGFGLGLRLWPVTRGAALLFLTNLVAIVVVGTVSFLATGFNRVDVLALEQEELAREGKVAPLARLAAQHLARVFESRWGPVLRLLMPLALLAAVYVPLRRALDEVAWEVRVRSAVTRALGSESEKIVRSQVRIERHEVRVVLVILGTATDANAARRRLEARVRAASLVAPSIEVFAIPDANAFAGLAASLVAEPPVTSAPSPSFPDKLEALAGPLRAAIDAVWPAASHGGILHLDIEAAMDVSGPLRVRVVHLGAPLLDDTAEVFHRSLVAQVGHEIELVDVAVPARALTRDAGDVALAKAVAAGVHATIDLPDVAVCVFRPAASPEQSEHTGTDAELARALDDALARHPRVTVVGAGPWEVRFVSGHCPTRTVDGSAPASSAEGGASARAAPSSEVTESGLPTDRKR
jgi:uncharacterized hydrophobic protein (TIGR00271 family)